MPLVMAPNNTSLEQINSTRSLLLVLLLNLILFPSVILVPRSLPPHTTTILYIILYIILQIINQKVIVLIYFDSDIQCSPCLYSHKCITDLRIEEHPLLPGTVAYNSTTFQQSRHMSISQYSLRVVSSVTTHVQYYNQQIRLQQKLISLIQYGQKVIRTHTGEKPNSCQQCDASFTKAKYFR